MELAVLILTITSFAIIAYKTVSIGLKLSKEYSNVLKGKPIYKSSNSYVSSHGSKIKGGRSKVYVYEDCILLYSSFLLLFISDDLGIVRKINFTEIESVDNCNYKWGLGFIQKRILICLKSGEKYSVRVADNDYLKRLIKSKIT